MALKAVLDRQRSGAQVASVARATAAVIAARSLKRSPHSSRKEEELTDFAFLTSLLGRRRKARSATIW
jgi:hypothetical protein